MKTWRIDVWASPGSAMKFSEGREGQDGWNEIRIYRERLEQLLLKHLFSSSKKNIYLLDSKTCIQLRFQRILKDFFKIKKFLGIQSRLLRNLKHSCGIQLGFSWFFNESNKILVFNWDFAQL